MVSKLSLLSLAAVSVMLAVVVLPFFSEDSDAEGEDYYYVTVGFTGQNIDYVKLDGVDAVSARNGQPGSWDFDSDGYGPFGSYYAAFDERSGKVYGPLDPDNLRFTVGGGVDVLEQSDKLSFMWVLPTVYWKVEGNVYTLTNDPNAGGIAYAHTFVKDGVQKVYQNVGYAVYESSGTGITHHSQPDKTPVTGRTIAALQDHINFKNTIIYDEHGHFFDMWNFHQWTLYKMISYAVIGSKDILTDFGLAYSHSNPSALRTGTMDAQGPFVASEDGMSGSKIFIENVAGSLNEYLKGICFVDGVIESTGNSYPISGSYSLPASGWIDTVYTEAEVFDLPKTSVPDSAGYGRVQSSSGEKISYIGGAYNWAYSGHISSFYGNFTATNSNYSNTSRMVIYADAINLINEDKLHVIMGGVFSAYLPGDAVSINFDVTLKNRNVELVDAPDWIVLSDEGNLIVGSIPSDYSGDPVVTFAVKATSPMGQTDQATVMFNVDPFIAFTSKPTASCIVIPVYTYNDDGSVDAGIVDDIVGKLPADPSSDTYRFVFIGSKAERIIWDFGDGSFDEGNSVVHTFAKAGKHLVTCQAINSLGDDQCEVEIHVDKDYTQIILIGILALLVTVMGALLFRRCRRSVS